MGAVGPAALMETRRRQQDENEIPSGLLKTLGFTELEQGLYLFRYATKQGTLKCYVDYDKGEDKPGLYSYLNSDANELWRKVEPMQIIRRYHEDQLATKAGGS